MKRTRYENVGKQKDLRPGATYMIQGVSVEETADAVVYRFRIVNAKEKTDANS